LIVLVLILTQSNINKLHGLRQALLLDLELMLG
jgi:hypothetical protein